MKKYNFKEMDPNQLKKCAEIIEKFSKIKYGSCNKCYKALQLNERIRSVPEPWSQSPFNAKYCMDCVPEKRLTSLFNLVERKIDQNDCNKIHLVDAIFKFAVNHPEYRMPSHEVLIKIKTEKPESILKEMLDLNVITKECYDDVLL